MIKLKTEVNKSALMREIKQQALDIYENSSESYEKSQAFIAGAESFFDLLRLPVVIVPFYCNNDNESVRCKEQCLGCDGFERNE